MKRITAIVRPEKMEKLKDALFAVDVSGMTISQVQGCGNQHGWSEYVRGTEVLLNMVPKVKFELIVSDDEVDKVLDVVCETAPHRQGGRRQDLRLERRRGGAHPAPASVGKRLSNARFAQMPAE
jgi:nitrogen regulatory protein P-II 1